MDQGKSATDKNQHQEFVTVSLGSCELFGSSDCETCPKPNPENKPSLKFEITSLENASSNLEEVLVQGKTLIESFWQAAESLEKKADQWINRCIILLGGMVGFWAKLISEKQIFLSCYAIGIIVVLAVAVFLFYRSSSPSAVALLGLEPKSWEKDDRINKDRRSTAFEISAYYQDMIEFNEERYTQKAKLLRYALQVLLGASIAIIPLLVLFSVSLMKA